MRYIIMKDSHMTALETINNRQTDRKKKKVAMGANVWRPFARAVELWAETV